MQELSRFPRMQTKLIEVVSDLLRERLGPCSGYVESLIAIQRAYINTNHPNFLGAAAAMSSVINSRQEKEKKAALAEERRKRERRRLRDVGGVNGVEGDDPEGGSDEVVVQQQQHTLPSRHLHQTKGSRSMSPVVRGHENGGGSHIASALNGVVRGASPTRSTAGGSGGGVARDSFLNYFFGKEGGPSGSGAGVSNNISSAAGSHRHVSQHVEPSFAQSIRRGDNSRVVGMDRQPTAPSHHDLESNYDLAPVEQDYSYPSFVSIDTVSLSASHSGISIRSSIPFTMMHAASS